MKLEWNRQAFEIEDRTVSDWMCVVCLRVRPIHVLHHYTILYVLEAGGICIEEEGE